MEGLKNSSFAVAAAKEQDRALVEKAEDAAYSAAMKKEARDSIAPSRKSSSKMSARSKVEAAKAEESIAAEIFGPATSSSSSSAGAIRLKANSRAAHKLDGKGLTYRRKVSALFLRFGAELQWTQIPEADSTEGYKAILDEAVAQLEQVQATENLRHLLVATSKMDAFVSKMYLRQNLDSLPEMLEDDETYDKFIAPHADLVAIMYSDLFSTSPLVQLGVAYWSLRQIAAQDGRGGEGSSQQNVLPSAADEDL